MLHGLRPSALEKNAGPAAFRRRAVAVAVTVGAIAATTLAGASAASAARPSNGEQYAVAAYVYKKIDAKAPAAWENSTEQFLVATWDGRNYRYDLTFDEIQDVVGEPICGSGWAIQQDKAFGTQDVFTKPDKQPWYPKSYIGWWTAGQGYQAGKLYEASHWNLEAFTSITVPACGEEPSATPEPVVTPKPEPSASVSATPTPTPAVPAPAPTEEPKPTTEPTPVPTTTAAAPSGDVSPAPTAPAVPVVPVASEVLSAAPTPTPSPSVTSAVLAATPSGKVLAATGSNVGPILGVAGVLLVGGAGLVVARQRRARQQA
jgi:LPXTG-motif cell wall-anchored protein